MTSKLALTATLFVLGCGHAEPLESPADRPPIAVSTTVVAQMDAPRRHVVTGTLRGRNTATITPRAMGHVQQLLVEPGERVHAGQLLAVLDAAPVRASLQQAQAQREEARAARTQAEAAVRAASAALGIAETTRDRVERLRQDQAVSQQDRDQAEAAYLAAAAEHAAAEAAVVRAESRIRQAGAVASEARINLDYAQVEAPFDGLVLNRSAHVGDLVQPGVPLFALEEQGTLRAELAVPASLVGEVRLGGTIELEVDAAGVVVSGDVDEIVPDVDPGSRAFTAKVHLAELAPSLRPGMFVRGRIRTGTRRTIALPVTAVSPRGSLDRVFVVDAEGRARLRLVTLGERWDGQVDVLSGLEEGERVVLSPPPELADRRRVEVQP